MRRTHCASTSYADIAGKKEKADRTMGVDLRELENKLTNILADLDAREAQLKEELRAIDLVKQASEGEQATATAVSTTEGSIPESTPSQPQGTSPAELSATMEAPLRIQEGNFPQQEPTPAAVSAEPTAIQEAAVEPELAPEATVPEEEPKSLKVLVANATTEDAVLAVLRSWETRLKSAKIAEELIAAGYPFPSSNPLDLVTSVLQDMARDNKIKKVRTIKGTYFTLL